MLIRIELNLEPSFESPIPRPCELSEMAEHDKHFQEQRNVASRLREAEASGKLSRDAGVGKSIFCTLIAWGLT